MNAPTSTHSQQSQPPRRAHQESSLRHNESALQSAAANQDKQAFFDRITSLLRPLKSYIKRRLITAYANWEGWAFVARPNSSAAVTRIRHRRWPEYVVIPRGARDLLFSDRETRKNSWP